MAVLVFGMVLASTFGAALLGLYLAPRLPEHHVTDASKETVHAIMGVIALLAAVVLGLLVYSAKTSFDLKDMEFRHTSAKVVLLDRIMAHYGPETARGRALLKSAVERKLTELAPGPRRQRSEIDASFAAVEAVQDELRRLEPLTEAQRWLKKRALDVSGEIAEARWFLLADLDGTIPMPFLLVLVFWLALIFFSYGLFVPANGTALAVILLSGVSLAAAIFLVLEMDNSLDGPIAISFEPLRKALEQLGR